ncbi:MAG: type II toxin-antitoxin system HipA family toxin [Nannocystaceae bacterium]
MSSTLDVLLGEVKVGALEQFDDERYVFAFDAGWLADPERPILGQLFEDRRPQDIEVWGPPCWFAHLLPQGPLRRAIAQAARTDEGDVFALLQVLAADLPGAVVLRPGDSPARRRRSEAARPATTGPLRFALAGAQWKLSLRSSERGLVAPVAGETGHWIAKFHDPTYPELPRVEWATMEWARRSGITVPPCRLGRSAEIVELPAEIPTGDGSLYLVERFDRTATEGRVHMEDFGQVLDRPPGHAQYIGGYELIAAVLAAIAPVEDLEEFCRRVVFTVLCGNTDAHLKNWSVLYRDRRRPRLSPAYDLVASVLYVPRVDDELALDLAGSKRFEAVTIDSFRRLAAVCDRDFSVVARWVREASARVREAWSAASRELAFTSAERARLDQHMSRVGIP